MVYDFLGSPSGFGKAAKPDVHSRPSDGDVKWRFWEKDLGFGVVFLRISVVISGMHWVMTASLYLITSSQRAGRKPGGHLRSQWWTGLFMSRPIDFLALHNVRTKTMQVPDTTDALQCIIKLKRYTHTLTRRHRITVYK